jgi:predicted ATPase
MLEQIVLNNFLFFNNYQHFNLKRINLLTGLNNTGKTNFLKSILLIRQSLPSLFKNNELTLNSKIIKFGTFNDISNDRELLIKIKYNDLIHYFKSLSIKNSIEYQKWEKVKVNILHYYIRSCKQNIPKISDLERVKILDTLKYIRYDHNNWNSAMALILASLRAKPNDIIISEHPGERFHPYCQSKLIEALFTKKKNDVQWFIETHSNTILNAFRILVKRQHIDSDDLNILHFPHKNSASPITVKVDSDGRIEDWPEYFFDQDDKDYEELFGL